MGDDVSKTGLVLRRILTFCFHLGRAAGIDVRVHWSFLAAPLYIYWRFHELGMPTVSLLIVLMLALFGCILLHEFGHALAARCFNVPTRDIIITPIGGMARLVRMPIKPVEELLITVAGPVVNLVIAGLFFLYLFLAGQPLSLLGDVQHAVKFPQLMMWANVVLFLFNLIPAFPMDGGRILRSSLSIFLGHQRATKAAVVVGKILAILFIIASLYFGFIWLGIVGVFVFLAAGTESAAASAAAVSESRYEEPALPFK